MSFDDILERRKKKTNNSTDSSKDIAPIKTSLGASSFDRILERRKNKDIAPISASSTDTKTAWRKALDSTGVSSKSNYKELEGLDAFFHKAKLIGSDIIENVTDKDNWKNALDETGNQIQSGINGAADLTYKGIDKFQSYDKSVNNNTWFKTGDFSDGYNLGDISKSILGTTVNTAANIQKGVDTTASNISKFISGGIAQGIDLAGNKEFADKMRERIANQGTGNSINEKILDVTNNSSLLGEKSQSIAQNIGNVEAMAGLSLLKVNPLLTSFSSAAGGQLQEAYKNGATNNEALLSAGISGASEALSEKIFGGLGKVIGKGSLDDILVKKVTNKISNKLIQNIAKTGILSAGEGLEEVISGYGDAIGKKLTYMNSKQLKEIYSSKDALNDFVSGAITSIIVQAPSTIQDTKNIKNENIINSENTELKKQNYIYEQSDNTYENVVRESAENNNNLKQNITLNEENKNKTTTKAEKYMNRSKNKFVNNLVSDLQTSKFSNKNTLNSIINEIETEYKTNKNISEEKKNDFFEKIYSNLIKYDNDYAEQYKDLKKELRDTKLYVDEDIKNNIENFNFIRKKNFGILNLSSDSNSTNIDTKYMELSDRYPDLFPDNIYNKADQLNRIIEVANDLKIAKTNVESYVDSNLGPEYKKWAKEEFNKEIDSYIQDLNMSERYNNDITEKSSDNNISKSEVKDIYKNINQYRKIYEKTLSQELLTKKDSKQVDRLIKNEISIDEIPKDCNIEGIKKVYNSKLQYNELQNTLNKYNSNIKEQRLNQAIDDIGDVSKWKDKKIGFLYSRETPERNIYDVAPKENADKINNNYIQTYKHNETIVTRVKNNLNEQINKLKLGDSKKYSITFSEQDAETKQYKNTTKKVSESALVQLFGEKRITEEQLKKSGADVNKINNAVITFRKIYNNLIKQANEVLIDNGYAPIEYRQDYFPHFTEDAQDTTLGKIAKLVGIDISNQELPTDIAGMTQNFKPGKRWLGNLLQRTTDITDFDAKKGFDRYVDGITDIIFHTEDIKKFRALESAIRGKYNTEQIEQKISAVKDNANLTSEEKIVEMNQIYNEVNDKSHLSHFVTWLQNYTNIIAGKKSVADRHLEQESGRNMYKTMQNVESKIAANMVGGNIGVSISNFAVLAQATGEVKTLNLVQGLWDTARSTIKRDKSFISESEFITRRKGSDVLSKSKKDKVLEVLTSPLNFADSFSSEVIVRSMYKQKLQEGLSKQQALQEADRYASKLMADRSKGALPSTFYSKNPLTKLNNMFQVEVNNQWSHYFKDMPRDSKSIANLAKGYTKVLVSSYLINELIGNIRGNGTRLLPDPIYIVKELIKSLTDDDEDNDGDAFLNAGKEILGNLPFVSVPAALFGLDDIGRIPISGVKPDVQKVTKSTVDLVTGNDEEGVAVKNIGKELLESLSYFTLPFGAAQLKKTYEGVSLYDENKPVAGSYNDEGDLKFTADNSTWGKIQAGLFGQYASNGAQEYIDSGFSNISSKNLNELQELGMDSTEYRKYKKGLSEAKTKADKYEYISKLDVSDKKKNIMLNNLEKDSLTDSHGYEKYTEENAYVYDSKGFAKCKILGSSTVYWYDSDNNKLYNSNYKVVTGVNKSKLERVTEDNTYWYDSKTKTIYDTKYNVVDNKNIKDLEKAVTDIDITEYNKYNSYEEFDFAYNNSEKYNVVKQICEYEDYSKYTTQISKIKNKYKNTTERKQAVFNYIDSLNLDAGQKTMLLKEGAGYSITDYKKQMYKYIDSLKITNEEKTKIWKELYD